MTINVPLLRKTMEHIEAHPDQHDQAWWARRTSCGTTHCFAGWAILLDDPGAEIMWRPWCGGGEISEHLTTEQWILARAQRVLGLDHGDVNRLFCSENSRFDLRRIVDELIAQSAEAGAT